MNTHISFVVTARNDNYGGNWINRINAFMKVLAYQAARVKLPIELIFVEYNPPQDNENMYSALTVPHNEFFAARFIVVPNKFHKTLDQNEKVTVCEFIGKNIGVRRASSPWIIATNPDVLFGNEIFDFFSQNKLQTDKFYRVNRRDLSTNFVDPKLSAEQILSAASKHITKILYNNQTEYISMKEWFNTFIHGRTKRIFLQCPLFNNLRNKTTDDSLIHGNAAGDFLLMHRDMWAKVRGYDEITVGSGVLDGYIMFMLYCLNFTQQILPYPIYHLNHHHKGVKYLASHEKFKHDSEQMFKTKIPYKEYNPNWGFPEYKFEEIKK